MLVSVKPTPPPGVYEALQVRRITDGGNVQFVDGTERTYGADGAITTNSGTQTPNSTDWVVTLQDPVNTPEAGYGQPDPSPSAKPGVFTNTQFQVLFVPA